MDELEKTMFDVEELSRKIDERIRELEEKELIERIDAKIRELEEEEKRSFSESYSNVSLGEDMDEISKLIEDIDRRIAELEKEEEKEMATSINVIEITDKINSKLDNLSFEEQEEEDLEKTLYDLSEISKIINETIAKLEKEKEKKKKKKMYCDKARKEARKKNNCQCNKKECKCSKKNK